ncbi:MAG: TetR family transcriptional regulator [Acidimicrobiales bacterium]
MSRSGRRPGTPDTRETILAAARRGFGARGYGATSLRSIAEEAAVDPALLMHYFGTKEGLFAEAVELPVRPSSLLAGLATSSPAEGAELILRAYLAMIDYEPARNAYLGLVRSAVADERAAILLREFLTEEILTVIGGVAKGPDAQLKAALVAAQLVGIAMLRVVVQVEALAQASNDEIVSAVAPAIEGYLR